MKQRCLDAFRAAARACDPTARVAAVAPRAEVGIAIGKAALAMARGAQVERGLVVSPVDGQVPGWTTIVSAHPIPDDRSVAAARAVRALVASATQSVLALISGGASALIEEPRLPLPDFVAIIRAVMDAGASIHELNRVRTALSAIKGGKLVEHCPAPVVTLVASDVFDDALAVVGSGPTIGPWLAQPGVPVVVPDDADGAIRVLERYGVPVPAILRTPAASRTVTRGDRAELVVPMRAFADALGAALALPVLAAPYTGDVARVANDLMRAAPCVAWGEPTLEIPPRHGEGGRAQQLALELARRIRDTERRAFVAGSDGRDGPSPAHRPAPAGAYVDGTTWHAIVAAGIDPLGALVARDAGTALAAIGALVVTGPTGVNHADVAVVT